jgi:hypothetical protein
VNNEPFPVRGIGAAAARPHEADRPLLTALQCRLFAANSALLAYAPQGKDSALDNQNGAMRAADDEAPLGLECLNRACACELGAHSRLAPGRRHSPQLFTLARTVPRGGPFRASVALATGIMQVSNDGRKRS